MPEPEQQSEQSEQQSEQQPIDRATLALAAGLIRQPGSDDGDRKAGVIDPQQLLHWIDEAGTAWLRSDLTSREAALYGVIISRNRAIHQGIVKPDDDVAIALAQSAGINGKGIKNYIDALLAINAQSRPPEGQADGGNGGGGGKPIWKFW